MFYGFIFQEVDGCKILSNLCLKDLNLWKKFKLLSNVWFCQIKRILFKTCKNSALYKFCFNA